MRTNELSTCFCTTKVDVCREFYLKYFASNAIFDSSWYVTLKINQNGPEISFIQPQDNMPVFGGAGVMLNFKADDEDSECSGLSKSEAAVAMPLEHHPWGDRGFSVTDPIGNSVYIYSDRQPSDEFKQYYS